MPTRSTVKMVVLATMVALTCVKGTSLNTGWRHLLHGSCTDLNVDGTVDVSDLLTRLMAHGPGDGDDTNDDGATEVSDLLSVLSAFGSKSCIPGEWHTNKFNFRRGFHQSWGETSVGFSGEDNIL